MQVDGWELCAHPAFTRQVEALADRVEALRVEYPAEYRKKAASKLLAAIPKLAFEVIPGDPTRKAYRQGSTLGAANKHWFRAKFYQQFRLFFRYDERSKIIVYGWVNDDDTLRAYGSADDAYRTFERLLASGYPPTDWSTLLKQAQAETAGDAFRQLQPDPRERP